MPSPENSKPLPRIVAQGGESIQLIHSKYLPSNTIIVSTDIYETMKHTIDRTQMVDGGKSDAKS